MLDVSFDLLFVGIVAGAGALLLAALSPLLRRRYASRALSVIWLGLALWLVVPVHVTLATAPVQVTVPAQIARRWQQPLPGRYGGETGAQTGTVPPAQMATGQGVPTSESVATPQAAGENTTASALTLRQLALLGWLAGALVLAGWKAFAYRRWHRQIFRWNKPAAPAMGPINAKASANAGLWQPLTVYENPKISTAMLVGVARPVLLVPENFAAQPQAPLVLLHEYTHHRRCDLLKKLLLQGAVCLHWWNPAVWLLNRQAQQELELACDEAVLAVTGAAASAEYGRALLAAAAGPAPCLVSQFGSEKHQLKARLANLFRTGKRRGVAVVLACLLVGAGAGLLVACNGANVTDKKGEATAEVLTAETGTAADTAETALDNQKNAVINFLCWYVSDGYSYTQTRYQACAAAQAQGADAFVEAMQKEYYNHADDLATPELLEQLSANREPYRFDKTADQLGLQCLPMDCQVEATDQEDAYRFTMSMQMVRKDGSYTLATVTGQAWLDNKTTKPRVKTFQLNKKDGWPATAELLNATAEGTGSQKLYHLLEQAAPGTVPTPSANAVRLVGTPNEDFYISGNTKDGGPVVARLADLPQVVPVAAKEINVGSHYSQLQIEAYELAPGSYTVNTGVIFRVGGASSYLYYYGLSADGFASTEPQVGLLKTDGSVMYTLGGMGEPLKIDGDVAGSLIRGVELTDVPEGEYLVAFINPANSGATLSAELNCGPAVAGEGTSTFVNTRSEEGNVRADIDVIGNRRTRVISEIPAIKIRSAEGLTDLKGTVTDTTFDDKTLMMTVHCTYTGTDANGKNQEGTATFKVAYP